MIIVSSLSARFSSSWDASGQIPQRLDNGTTRFGSVDDTEGGTTSRTNLNASLSKPIDENTFLKPMRFIRNMILNCILISLSSLRTYKWRPDQAKENRSIYGMNAELNKKLKVMIGMRYFN
jgi:hypothetical protein